MTRRSDMGDLRAAAERALESLEAIDMQTIGRGGDERVVNDIARAAIAELAAALAAEQAHPDAVCDGCGEFIHPGAPCEEVTTAEAIAAWRSRPAPAKQPQPVPKAVETAPPRIWLQISDDRDHLDEPFPSGVEAEVTWCSDSVGDAEIEYVRADLAPPAAAPSFDEWYDSAHWGNEDFREGCRRAWEAALAAREGGK